MSAKKIFLCVNSDVGKGNTIGARFGKIATCLQQGSSEQVTMFARGKTSAFSWVHTPWYGTLVGRGLNAIKMYLWPSVQYRRFEISLFDTQVYTFLTSQSVLYDLAHIGEYLPKTIAYLQSKGTRVLLDVPIGFDDYLYKRSEQGTYSGAYVKPTLPVVYKSIELADEVIAPSSFVASLILEKFPQKAVRIVPFGVDIHQSYSDRQITKKQERVHKACFVGGVSERKGIPDLMTVWKSLSPSIPLVLAGRVPTAMRQVVKGIEGVELAGFVKPQDIYAQSQLFILPTYMEGSAKVVYEAMAAGLLVITTHQAGSIITHNENGLLYEAGDVAALQALCKKAIRDTHMRTTLAINAYHTVRAYSWERYAQHVIDHYRL